MPGTNAGNQLRLANTELNRRIVMAENLRLAGQHYVSIKKAVKNHTPSKEAKPCRKEHIESNPFRLQMHRK